MLEGVYRGGGVEGRGLYGWAGKGKARMCYNDWGKSFIVSSKLCVLRNNWREKQKRREKGLWEES